MSFLNVSKSPNSEHPCKTNNKQKQRNNKKTKKIIALTLSCEHSEHEQISTSILLSRLELRAINEKCCKRSMFSLICLKLFDLKIVPIAEHFHTQRPMTPCSPENPSTPPSQRWRGDHGNARWEIHLPHVLWRGGVPDHERHRQQHGRKGRESPCTLLARREKGMSLFNCQAWVPA